MVENDGDDVLMHFVVPYDWKSTLRGLFWINIGLLAFFTGGLLLFIWSGILYMDQQATICTILGYIIIIAIYVVIRHVTVKYDEVKARREIIVKRDVFIFRKGNMKVEVPYTKTDRLKINISDKKVLIEGELYIPINGRDYWCWKLPRDTLPPDVDYKAFIETRVLPFVDLIISRLKEEKPNVQVIWNDTRKRYR